MYIDGTEGNKVSTGDFVSLLCVRVFILTKLLFGFVQLLLAIPFVYSVHYRTSY